MYVDEYFLPMQSDGNRDDQLQRVSMIVAASELTGRKDLVCLEPSRKALWWNLQPRPGVFIRFIGGKTDNVSGDQIISALAALVAARDTLGVLALTLRILLRLGFAQNYRDGIDDSKARKLKVPDFVLFRALPLITRAHVLLYPLAFLFDLILVIQAYAACGSLWRDDGGPASRSPNDVDQNVTILTLAVCHEKMWTPISDFAAMAFDEHLPWNYGCTSMASLDAAERVRKLNVPDAYRPVWGALRWYHRPEAKGNPEIAAMWLSICEEVFGAQLR